jgi:thymidylate synthase (FAD)
MYWKTNLHNLFHFLSLRCDPHAQYEIRVYAEQMLEMIEPFVPWAVKAFKDYNLHGMHLSRAEVDILRALTDHYAKSGDLNEWVEGRMEINGCSKREIREFLSKIAS